MKRGLAVLVMLWIVLPAIDCGGYKAAQWQEARKILFDFYINKSQTTQGEVALELPRVTGYQFISGIDNPDAVFGKLVAMELNQEGIKIIAGLANNRYAVLEPNGKLYFLEPAELKNPSTFAVYREIFIKGGTVQMLGFSEGFVVPQKNAKIMHFGPTIEKSFIEEKLGTATSRIDNFKDWDDSYLGKAISEIYEVNPLTGLKGRRLGWIADMVNKNITFNNEQMALTLKKIVMVDENGAFPQFVVTRRFPIGNGEQIVEYWKRYGGSSRHTVILPTNNHSNMDYPLFYSNIVIDDAGNPRPEEGLIKFDEELKISQLNLSE